MNQDISKWLAENAGLTTAVAATAGAALLYYLSRSGTRPEFPISVDDQSYDMGDFIRTSHFAKDGKLVEYFYEDAKTCHEAFVRGMKVSDNGPCLGMRTGANNEYEFKSYKEVYDTAHAFGSALIERGLKPRNDTYVGVFASNCSEWVIMEQACNMFSMVVVPLYDTLGTKAVSYIINQTEMTTVVCDTPKKVQALLDAVGDNKTLKTIVLVQGLTEELVDTASKAGIKLVTFYGLVESGKENLQELNPPKPDDLCTICYTSGTTGDPKGVMLTHKNLISNTAAILTSVPELVVTWVQMRNCHVSYLPLPHMFERAVQCMVYQHGAKVGFFGGDIKKLTEDIQALKPTLFPTVPRLLNRIYDKVMLGIQGSFFKTFLYNRAIASKNRMLKQGIVRNDTIWDRLVFKRIQDGLGGQVRFIVTGSAPLADNVMEFARCALGCKVFEGYGQTECTAGLTFSLSNEYRTGHVGAPLACNLVKLVDVPEMEYYARDGKGEVCCKGNNVMRGYFKDEAKTREAIDEDGWLHTGDVGQWLPTGALKIIDRKKHIFKLSQGEYLAPEKIENVYTRSSLVAQAFVDGRSVETFAVGVIVPDEEAVPQWAGLNGLGDSSFQELCQSEQLKAAILEDIHALGKQAGLKGFEQVRDIYVCAEQFSVDNGLLTPTFKSKRPQLRAHFKQQVDDMYARAKK